MKSKIHEHQENNNSNASKNTVLKYGLIAGGIVAAFMIFATWTFINNPDTKLSEVFGYTGMLVAFSFVFIGIKNFRDKQNEGHISFGKAFKIGILIALIASLIYVGVWLIEYYLIFPDFMTKYSEHMMKTIDKSALTAAEIKAKADEMKMYVEWYKNPIMVILLTFSEVFPIGLVVSLISALILKKQ